MQLIPIYMGMLDPLYKLFGSLMHLLYTWLGNYGLVVIVFSIILRALIMPLALKGRRGMLQQSKLSAEINEIKRLYPKDPQMQQQLQSQLFKANGISPMSGCLSSILSFVLMIAIWRPVQQPLLYIARVSSENIVAIAENLKTAGLLEPSAIKSLSRTDIPVLSVLRSSASALAESVNEGLINLDQLIDLDFLGMNLGLKPTINPSLLFGEQSSVYLPLLIFPIITIVTMIISMQLTKLTMPGMSPKDKEEAEREKKNPAKAGQTPEATGKNMMKSMNIIMPFVMLFTIFALPSAMGVYWVMTNLISICETLLFYNLYVKPASANEASARVITNSSLRAGKRKKNTDGLAELNSPGLDEDGRVKELEVVGEKEKEKAGTMHVSNFFDRKKKRRK